jgi:type IV pilus assembly protein PilE
MNQYMQDTGSYANAGACGKSAPATTKYAAYTCTATDTTYTVTMTGQDQIAAYAFTINELGTRATTASPHGTSASCWMIGSSC